MIPGPREILGVRSTLLFRRDPLRFLERMFAAHGDVVRFSLGGERVVAVFDPERVAALLTLPDEALEKASGPTFVRGERLAGVGIVTASGDTHRLHRSVAQTVLAGPRLRRYRDQLTAMLAPVVDGWADGAVLDLAPALRAVLRRAAVTMLFGRDPDDPANGEGIAALDVLVKDLDRSGLAVLWARLLPGGPVSRATGRAWEALATWTADLPEGCVAHDLLDAGREADPRWGMPEVHANLVQLYMTAYDTTLNSLLWTLWLLARHPEAAARVVDDAWLDVCVKESLRLYPTGPYGLRRPVREVRIGEERVPVGTAVLYSPWVTHRHPGVWDDPEVFRPERFQGAPPPRGAYVPFGLGGRSCVGAALGTLQVRTATAYVLGRVSLEPVPGTAVRPHADDAVRPVPGVPVTVRGAR